jgi:hypothetical protein
MAIYFFIFIVIITQRDGMPKAKKVQYAFTNKLYTKQHNMNE